MLNPLTYTIMNIGIVAVLWFGGGQVSGGDLTQGEIIAFVNYMTQILLSLLVGANLVVTVTKASASAARVNEVLETKSSIISINQTAVEGKTNMPQISFQNVEFSYKGAEEPSLQGITCLLYTSGQECPFSVHILIAHCVGDRDGQSVHGQANRQNQYSRQSHNDSSLID